MNRFAFLLKVKNGFESAVAPLIPGIALAEEALGVTNFSVWNITHFVFCYGELPGDKELGADEEQYAMLRAVIDDFLDNTDGSCELLAYPDEMRLMYHDIGTVREDKSLIRHRVFGTHIHPGCAEEYKARHDALIEARGGDSDAAETNFTIWCAKDEYNFGYCELVKEYDHEQTEEEKESARAWETKMLEIMDWYTDDVDWISGLVHPPIRLLYA